MRLLQFFLVILMDFCFAPFETHAEPTPVVLWHGMGDNCCNPGSMGRIKEIIENEIPGVYVYSMKIGETIIEDTESGYFKNINNQMKIACDIIRNDPKLKNGYHAVGFSQGGLLIRGLAQRCPDPRVRTLVMIGGPQQGVYGLPNCQYATLELCDWARKLLNHAAYTNFLQEVLVQAQYWHDPLNEELYKQKSTFLSDINNEVQINQSYIDALEKIQNLVFVKFNGDEVLEPLQSEWFGFYKPGFGNETIPLNETTVWTKDQLGLQKLAKDNKLTFLELPGNHLHFSDEWFIESIIKKFLKA